MIARAFKRVLSIGARLVVLFVVLTVMLVLPWRWLNPPTTAFIIAHDINQAERLPLQWVDLKALGPELQLAVISAEDQKFPYHWGFDLDSIKSALRAHREGRARLRGAHSRRRSGRNYRRGGHGRGFPVGLSASHPASN